MKKKIIIGAILIVFGVYALCMATEFIIPGSGIHNDTEQGFEPIVPGTGIYNEETAAAGVTMPIFMYHYMHH